MEKIKNNEIGHSILVDQIRRLSWERLSQTELEILMVLSYYAAREFAESLRLALANDPTSGVFTEMASGELCTTNLSFDDYKRAGDHADFLYHFVQKYNLFKKHSSAVIAGEAYLRRIRALDVTARIMSIVSRERELPGIFTQILKAKDWSKGSLPAFKYYLEQHILLDSSEGGHADLLKECVVDDQVSDFYLARMEMYRCLPTLFKS